MSYPYKLGDSDQCELLRVARSALAEFLQSGSVPAENPQRPELTTPAGAFVSLHKGAALRGCIGTQNEDQALFRTIQEMAVAAGTRDPRFAPVTADELADLTLEVSVLGQFAPLGSPDELTIGEHGLVIDAYGRRGLLLPQVATDHGLDRPQFLVAVCRKAGLADDAWRDDNANLERFTAQVFHEPTA